MRNREQIRKSDRERKQRQRKREREQGKRRKPVTLDHRAHDCLHDLSRTWQCTMQTAASHLITWAHRLVTQAELAGRSSIVPSPFHSDHPYREVQRISWRGRFPAPVYLSLFSGVESLLEATTDWWRCAGVAQYDPDDGKKQFAARVLESHLPDGIENLGDVTRLTPEMIGGIDLVVAGTPCQSFSAAGRRLGLEDRRGALTPWFMHLATRAAVKPSPAGVTGVPVILWENVPTVLSGKQDGKRRPPREHPFCIVLGMLGGANGGAPLPYPKKNGRTLDWGRVGYYEGPERRVAWRVLDASRFGVPQQRERLFLVAARNGDGIDPVRCLFDKAPPLGPPLPAPGGRLFLPPEGLPGPDGPVPSHLDAVLVRDPEREARFVLDPAAAARIRERALRYWEEEREPDQAEAERNRNKWILDMLEALAKGRRLTVDQLPIPEGRDAALVDVYGTNGRISSRIGLPACTVTASYGNEDGYNRPIVARTDGTRVWVRWLMPVEAERLMGFPDDWTLLPDTPEAAQDFDRFRAIGNAIAIPPLRWICRLIYSEIRRAQKEEGFTSDEEGSVFNPLTGKPTTPVPPKEPPPLNHFERQRREKRRDQERRERYERRMTTYFPRLLELAEQETKGR